MPLAGPQFLVRERDLAPVNGRPDPLEQAQIAEGVGALLCQLRRDAAMGIRDLEARSGVHRATISRLEAGLRRPRRSTLGWLSWGLDPEEAAEIKARLITAAGRSLIAENRWSERTKARRVYWALVREPGMPVPLVMLAPYAVAALGPMLPDDLDRLRAAEEMARRGEVPLPDSLHGSPEALVVGNVLAGATRQELAVIGRNASRWADYGKYAGLRAKRRARRAREREEYMANRRRYARRSAGPLAAGLYDLMDQRRTDGRTP